MIYHEGGETLFCFRIQSINYSYKVNKTLHVHYNVLKAVC